MTDIIDWPQEKIDALLDQYSETQDIDVTMQNMAKRIAELEQELSDVIDNAPTKQQVRDEFESAAIDAWKKNGMFC